MRPAKTGLQIKGLDKHNTLVLNNGSLGPDGMAQLLTVDL